MYPHIMKPQEITTKLVYDNSSNLWSLELPFNFNHIDLEEYFMDPFIVKDVTGVTF